MTLFTPENHADNFNRRIELVESIIRDKDLVTLHTNANRPALAKNAIYRIADNEYSLYLLHKDYDEMIAANVGLQTPRKTTIQKLLRK